MNNNKLLKNVIDGEFNEKGLIKFIQHILRNNNIIISSSVVQHDFKMLIDYIKESFYNHEIVNVNDLKLYIIDEMETEIYNIESLFDKYFDNKYYEISSDFKFVEVI